ncbi:sialate O-acetylesterase [Spirosoma pollinicola]|uniref:sialate O-acetylesterase n=1 Tax=Spirosoma pollinicola TaxID=2057025 RepID=UPI001F0B7DDE|nr:sialate O-acetylesterase [Spirosoma pollinicola]
MKFVLTFLFIFFLCPFYGLGQSSVVFEQWPARLQLYPRDQTSNCTVSIAGRVSTGDVTTLSLVVLRNQQRYKYARTNTDSLTGRFAFKPIIKAELSQYSFQVFAHRTITHDSIQVAFRDSIVCGDVFLIMGQSNAVGRFDSNPFRSEFCRTFGVNKGDVGYNPADTAWCLTNTSEGVNTLWGVELQRYIKEKQGIPTAIINGAVGSTDITSHAKRDANQPASMNSLYGRLYYRASKAGVASQVKAMIWRQGEAEAANDPDVYIRVFPRLYSYWKKDYPGLKKVYHSQLNILAENVVRAGALRDFQRRSNATFGDNEPIATVGLPGYQGLHYNEAGYRQYGLELYRLIARDFYASADTSNIRSPNVQRLYYSTPEQDEITLEFDTGQEVHWPADTIITNPATGRKYTQSLSSFVFTDYPTGENVTIKSVTEQENRLVLKLTKPSTAKHFTYLPSSYKDIEVGYYAGPVIRNRRGMRALTFYQVPIAAPLAPATSLQAVPVDTSAIKLTWAAKSDSVKQWAIERADSAGTFNSLALLPGNSTTYLDLRNANGPDSLIIGKLYKYRVQAIGRLAESGYSPVASVSFQLPVIPKVGPELELDYTGSLANSSVLVYPNPASNQVRVRLPLDWSGGAVLLTLTNEAGNIALQRNNQVSAGTPFLSFSVASLPVGTYVLTMQYTTGGVRCRLVVTH